MKNFTFLAMVSCMLLTAFSAGAQKQRTPQPAETKQQEQLQQVLQRCGTMEAIEQRLQNDPVYRANYEKGLRDFQRSQSTTSPNSTARTSTLTGPVTIPVVVHIVLPNPNVVTDADVQYFIDRLNRDFSGLNADSANGAPFYGVRGHSLIRFAMARRDPSGNLTNGIERKVGTGLINGGEPQPIKNATTGLAPWDHTKYYNVWVGDGGPSGLLGIAPEIGVGTAASDGVCVAYNAFANNSCYTIPAFNLGRTAVHEVGHNFGLFHTFQGNCGNQDFQQLTTPTMLLPDALLSTSDDTPAQNGPTSGCPAGTVAAGCATSPNPPGKMYQNYMDYTDDACYSMFTKGQVERMHYLLENFRPGYLTTLGHIPPAGAITLDVRPFESVNPGGSELIGCTSVSYAASVNCPGAITPKVRIRNNGLDVLTSVTVGYVFNGTDMGTVTLTGLNLVHGGTTVATLAPTTLIDGTNQFKFYTKLPNGGTDQNPTNDTLVRNLDITALPLPVTQDFVSTTFPPANWSVVSVNTIGTRNWVRNAAGNVTAGSAVIQNFSNSAGAIDDFRSGSIAIPSGSMVSVNFDVAHRAYTGGEQDVLKVLISTDCGATFTEIYSKNSSALATGTPTSANYIPASAADWRAESVIVPAALLASGKIQVVFRSVSDFGNNIYIDNINIKKLDPRDLSVTSVTRPVGDQCAPTFTPQVVVKNEGTEAITSYTITYLVDGVAVGTVTGTGVPLAPGASTTVTLPAYTSATGTHTFAARVASVTTASGTGDMNTANDQATSSYTLLTLVTTSIVEGFETPGFPPPGWKIFNPNNNNTWIRRAPGKASGFSAFIDNFTNDFTGQRDELRSPALSTVGVDSIIVNFDLAHKNYPGFNDQLAVIASTDCGATWQVTTFNRSGTALATAGESTADYVNPAASDWKTQRVALGGSFMSSGSLLIGFRNTAGFGNNIFIDNINTSKVFKRDLQLVSIDSVKNIYCATTTVTPRARVRNAGVETITGFKAAYTIDGGAPQVTTITGVSIPSGGLFSATLSNFTTTLGNHTLRVYTFDPITASGTGDMQTINDSLSMVYGQTGEATPPVVEGFEGTQFAPNNWAYTNPDMSNTWARANVGRNSTGSAFMRNFGYTNGAGRRDELYSPTIRYNGVDSVRLSFDLSAVTGIYPGSTTAALDTLEVLLTKDCGNTFTSIYKKWGEDLQTVSDPNFAVNASFVPTADYQWRRETIDLTGIANSTGNQAYQVVFRNTSNRGNNIYVDNVSFTTRTLPAQLKQNGYLILPTAFTSQFQIWHYLTPTALRYVTVHSSAGHQVYRKEFSGNGERVITVDLSSQPAGTYIVSLGYDDEYRNVSERVIKR